MTHREQWEIGREYGQALLASLSWFQEVMRETMTQIYPGNNQQGISHWIISGRSRHNQLWRVDSEYCVTGGIIRRLVPEACEFNGTFFTQSTYHFLPTEDEGSWRLSTPGFRSYMSTSASLILVEDMMFPPPRSDDRIGYTFSVWSNLIFKNWLRQCRSIQSVVAGLRTIVFKSVDDISTLGIMTDILSRHTPTNDIYEWNHFSINIPEEDFLALLGTRYGAMVTDLLSDHSNAFAKRNEDQNAVEKVKIVHEIGFVYKWQASTHGTRFDMYFTLEDVEPPPNTDVHVRNVVEEARWDNLQFYSTHSDNDISMNPYDEESSWLVSSNGQQSQSDEIEPEQVERPGQGAHATSTYQTPINSSHIWFNTSRSSNGSYNPVYQSVHTLSSDSNYGIATSSMNSSFRLRMNTMITLSKLSLRSSSTAHANTSSSFYPGGVSLSTPVTTLSTTPTSTTIVRVRVPSSTIRSTDTGLIAASTSGRPRCCYFFPIPSWCRCGGRFPSNQ